MMETMNSHPELSPRERQLIELAAKGMTDTAIAHSLGISEPTVKSYWGRVRGKFGARKRTELVAHALREGREQVVAELTSEIKRLKAALFASDSTVQHLHRLRLESDADAVFAVDEHGRVL